MFTRHDRLKPAYDVVIIGGGGHGLAAAYYLARDHGITNVCVLEKGYLGGGNTGRNTTIIRSNYLTPEGVKFYDESVRLWQDLAQDFDLNLFYSNRGHFTLAHTDAALRTSRWRAEVNKHFGIESEVVGPEAVKAAPPMMDLSCGGHAPILGALYHAPGAIARHDAVAWGYGRGADLRGVEIHQRTEVLRHRRGRRQGHRGTHQSRQYRHAQGALCGRRIDAARPRHGRVSARQSMSIRCRRWSASRSSRGSIPILVSGSLHVYISQSARGELVMGASLDPYEVQSTRSTFDFAEGLSAHMLDMFPFLSNVKVMRQWAGMADMTPDFAPIMGRTPVEGFYLDGGWGTWGFKATPVCGKTMS